METRPIAFSSNLVLFRKKKYLKQRDLAAALGVSASAVSSWETGISTPQLETLYRICDFLDITLSALLGIEDYCSADERELLDAYRGHPEMQKAVRTLLGLD